MRLFVLALFVLACSHDVLEEEPSEVSWAECHRRFEIDRTDHVVCQAMLERECSEGTEGLEREDSCFRAEFFPSFYQCWERDDLLACERSIQVDCDICQALSQATVLKLKEL
jgi:hypothetical protein